MSTVRRSVWTPQHHVRMDYGFSMIERDISAHPNQFVLAADGYLLVHFALGIEPPKRCSIHRSNSGEMRTPNLILLGKLQQSGKSLVSLVEDDHILFRRFARIQQANPHLGCLTSWNGFRRG